MLTLLALMLGLAAGEQQAASGTIISADEIAATLKQSIATNTVDQPIKLAQLPGGHKASVAMLRRTKAETNALIHDYVTEIYEIVEGSGTLVTGGSLEDPKESDLTRVNAGMSHTGAHKGGESRKVGKGDVVVLQPGTPHWFASIDGAITYLESRVRVK